jgi:hypothetical protein
MADVVVVVGEIGKLKNRKKASTEKEGKKDQLVSM